MRICSFLACGALFLPSIIQAQTASPSPASVNWISNGGFEQFVPDDNLWDGVDSAGYLAGFRRNLPAVTDQGNVADVAMPISVALADMNGDGLTDLVTADPVGYYRIYFNSGTKTEPKFTTAEMIPLYLSRINIRYSEKHILRYGPRIALTDWGSGGPLGLAIGTYGGEVFRIDNKGSVASPMIGQPGEIDKTLIKTSKYPEAWGNMFAPAVEDWNKDGRPDLLLGEGSYSANAIHLLVGENAGVQMKFSEDKRYYLCFGDGREQLVPCVVDYNGDGLKDVLVADRKGTIAVHLGVPDWKPGAELKQASLVSFGSTTSLSGAITVAAGDLNGDGLFDLVVGKNNGRMAMALNKGTKEQPKFASLVDLKGTDTFKRTMGKPSGWDIDYGLSRGNMYSYVTSVSVAEEQDCDPAEGKKVLKIGFDASPNKVLRFSPVTVPLNYWGGQQDNLPLSLGDHFVRDQARDAAWTGFTAPTNTFVIQKRLDKPLEAGKSYQLTFKVKGKGFSGRYFLAYYAWGERSMARVSRQGDRGGENVQRDEIREVGGDLGTISPSTQWLTVTKTVSVNYREYKEFNSVDKWTGISTPKYHSTFQMEFTVSPTGYAYIDDVQLVAK